MLLIFNFYSIFILVVSTRTFVSTFPQIFDDVYTFCELEYGGKKLIFPDKLWTVEKRNFVIHFSLCKSVQSKCRNKTASCLIFKKNNKFIDLGHEFITDYSDGSVLTSKGDKCPSDPSKTYSVSISLQCSDSTNRSPRLIFSDEEECLFEISMMTPDCQPKCTELINNSYLLNLRTFPKNIEINSGSRNFSLTLCGSNNRCPQGIGACEILNDGRAIPLATIESQHINYDVRKNALTARGRYKSGGVVRELQVLVKCNWQHDLFNATYKEVPTKGKKYGFVVESSFGCVKLPESCALTSTDNLNYNLAMLSLENGWNVANVPEGQITVNICGPLRSDCADQYSQICHTSNKQHINMGSILSVLEARDDMIRAVFVSGSTCQINGTRFSYSTRIEFRCSKTENGPVFKENRDCMMTLVWQTPRACPIDYYKSSTCYINDRISNRDLSKLHTKEDRIYAVSPKNKLIYNFCGPIHRSCNNFTNVSVCLKTEQSETVIGWETKELISENGSLRMELIGNACPRKRNTGKMTVQFVCSRENPPQPTEIEVIKDSCQYRMMVYTELACISKHEFLECVYSNDDQTYDLSSLVLKKSNYLIQGDDNVDYIFNLCGPIISGPDVLCRGDTMICLRNKTEVNVKKRYMSLGGVAKPSFQNNSLVVEANMGTFCLQHGHYKSIITFECSNRKFSPTFVSKSTCTYNFHWKTPEACPNRNCIVNGTNTYLDLTHLKIKSLKFNLDNKTNQYEFHLCKDVYREQANGENIIASLKREFFTFKNDSFLVLDLQKNCKGGDMISKIILKIECFEKNDDYFEKTSFENCILNITLYTKIICSSKNQYFQYSVNDDTSSDDSVKKTEVTTLVPQKNIKNCTHIEGKNGNKFDLLKIPSKELFFEGSYFTLNFEQPSINCDGFFCKNNIPLMLKTCPVVSFNYSDHFIKLHYLSSLRNCDSGYYILDVILKCNKTDSRAAVTKNELCRIILDYNIPAICDLLKEDTITSSSSISLAVSLTVILIVFFVFLLAYFTRKQWRSTRYLPFFRDKENTPIYIRNCRL